MSGGWKRLSFDSKLWLTTLSKSKLNQLLHIILSTTPISTAMAWLENLYLFSFSGIIIQWSVWTTCFCFESELPCMWYVSLLYKNKGIASCKNHFLRFNRKNFYRNLLNIELDLTCIDRWINGKFGLRNWSYHFLKYDFLKYNIIMRSLIKIF